MSTHHPLNSEVFNLFTYNPAQPAAGINMIFPCPANTRLEILAVTLTLTLDATVANRVFSIAAYDGSTNFQYSTHNILLAASVSRMFYASQGAEHMLIASVNSRPTMKLPINMLLDPGDSLVTDIFNIQATDQISDITIRVKHWTVTS